jgi:hypothetical protein
MLMSNKGGELNTQGINSIEKEIPLSRAAEIQVEVNKLANDIV